MIAHQVLLGREGDPELEQEAVELRLRQGIGAFHLERVLGRQDEERRIELVALARDRDLLLLHRLEEGRLGLGRGTVDLVGQHEVGEDRSRLEAELPAAILLDQDVGAHDVGRHQVGRELDAVEGAVDDLGHGAHEHRLAEPRHALQQRVAVGEHADQGLPDEGILTDDDPTDLALDDPAPLGEVGRAEGDGRRGGRSGGVGHRSSPMVDQGLRDEK